MADDTELQHFSNAEHLNEAHGTILQTLDRRVGKNNIRYDSKWFLPTVDAWATVPVIYAQEHPDMDAFDRDPAAELARIKGEIVGQVADPHIAQKGHPRLMGDTRFTKAEMDARVASGELSLSTGFRAPVKDGSLAGPVRPHHVLVFRESDSDQPADQGSGFLNQEKKGMADDDGKKKAKGFLRFLHKKAEEEYPGISAEIEADVSGGSPPDGDKDKEKNDMDADAQADKAEIARLQDELNKAKAATEAKEAEYVALKNKADALETERKEAAWQDFKNKPWVPKGYLHKDKEAETRQRFENDRAALFEELLNKKMEMPGGREGGEEMDHENKASSGTIGRFDAKKGEYVEE